MSRSKNLLLAVLTLSGMALGCQSQTTSRPIAEGEAQKPAAGQNDSAAEAEIEATLSKLSPEDQALAKSQKFCAVMSDERLGTMGAPLKLDIKGQAVFVCCKGCSKKALNNPDETLAKVAAMKSANATQP